MCCESEGARQLEQKYRVVTDLPVQERITRIGQNIKRHRKQRISCQYG